MSLVAGCAVAPSASMPKSISANDSFAAGIVAYEKADFDRAIAELDRAIATRPDHASAYFWRGRAHEEKKNFSAACADYERAIKLWPSYAEAYLQRGKVRHAEEDLDGALRDLNKAIALDPMASHYYANRGWVRRDKGDFAGAMADFDRMLVLNPMDANGYFQRGITHYKRGDSARALIDFDRGVLLQPGDALAYIWRARVKWPLGDLAGVIADLERSLTLDPNSAAALHDLALARSQEENYDAAIAAADRSLALGPLPDTYFIRGEARHHKGDLVGAIQDYDRGLALKPDDAYSRAARGILRHKTGDFGGAREDFTECLGLANTVNSRAESYWRRGQARHELKDFAGAITDYDAAIRIKPAPFTLHLRARTKAFLADYEGAIDDLSVALTMKPDDVRVLADRGWNRWMAGKLDEALMDLEHGLNSPNLDPKVELVLHQTRRNVHLARRDFARALDDADFVLRVQPDFDAYQSRGIIRYALGLFAGAASDYEQVIGLAPSDAAYPRFFRLLALRRLGQFDETAEFAQKVAAWPEGWPKKVGRFLAGELDAASFLTAAEDSDKLPLADRQCEAYFYLGTTCLLRGERDEAVRLFERCVAIDRPDFIEHQSAWGELERLRSATTAPADRSR